MRRVLLVAALAVALAAADTYVVVLALPDMMAGVGLSIDDLTRATPIVSAFLLGYVALLPLAGRLADERGRVPVLTAGLGVFAAGSLVTLLTTSLGMLETGRFLQGLGGGALVPATLALVADLYPPSERGLPLGLVSAAQEVGSVLGPVVGAVIISLADWRGIFALNLVLGLALAIALRPAARASDVVEPRPGVSPTRRSETRARRRRPDPVGIALGAVAVAGMALLHLQPPAMVRSLTWGELYVVRIGTSEWMTWIGWITIAALVLLAVRCWTARRPLVDLRSWAATLRRLDLCGALLVAVALGAIVLAFAGGEETGAVLAPRAGLWLAIGAVAVVLLVVRLRTAADPLLPRGLLRPASAWGALAVSVVTGGALVGALVDVPLFARTTLDGSGQVRAALVLARLLVAIPVGALAGGWLVARLPARVVAAVAMLVAAAGLHGMAGWDADALHHVTATIPLAVCGLGFGLGLAPVNAAALRTSTESTHALMASLVVAARMVGMLAGLSVLTALGLHAYDAHQAALPPIRTVCPGTGLCDAYTDLLKAAAISQEHTVFRDAAVAGVLAAILSLALLRPQEPAGSAGSSEDA